MKQKHIGIFVGSLRRQSFSSAIATAALEVPMENLVWSEVTIGGLPLYNQDFDDDNCPPAEWTEFRDTVGTLDGFLFITPEYNRSVPPVLKNAIDIASRPMGKNLWSDKPGAIISVSPGKIGGFGANHHLRQTLSCVNVLTLQQPEAYIGSVTELLDADGLLSDERTRQFLTKFLNAFAEWVMRCAPDGER